MNSHISFFTILVVHVMFINFILKWNFKAFDDDTVMSWWLHAVTKLNFHHPRHKIWLLHLFQNQLQWNVIRLYTKHLTWLMLISPTTKQYIGSGVNNRLCSAIRRAKHVHRRHGLVFETELTCGIRATSKFLPGDHSSPLQFCNLSPAINFVL